MKICTKCRRKLPLTEFNKRKDGKNGQNSQCRHCRSSYFRTAYKNSSERRAQVIQAVRRRRERLAKWVQSLKEKPCVDCHQSYPHYVMDFDHRVPSKKVVILSRIFLKGWSKEKILKEVEKCDLVCANCHRERTFGGQ